MCFIHYFFLLFLTSEAMVYAKPSVLYKCADNEYYNKQKSSCQLCDVACNGCSGPTEAGCIECAAGYANQSNRCDLVCDLRRHYVDFNTFECSKCNSSCVHGCIEDYSNCNSCGQHFYRPDTDSCPHDCPQDAGFYSNSFENRCVPCRDPACLSCEKDGECSKCGAWWQFDYSGRCVHRCPNGCASCATSELDDKVYCRKCFIGWTMEHNGTCSCPYKNCLRCGENGCLSCPEGFILDPLTLNCKECVKYCRICRDQTTCSVCSPGYRLSQNMSSCISCQSGCKYCTATKCTACEDGYHLDDRGKCLKVTYNYNPKTGNRSKSTGENSKNISPTKAMGNNKTKSTKNKNIDQSLGYLFGREYQCWFITIAIVIITHF